MKVTKQHKIKVTKQHKILAGLLVLGGLAVASDRLFFLKDSTAATAAPAAEYAVAATTLPASPTTSPAQGVVSIAQRLRQAAMGVADNAASRDAFSLGAAWPVPQRQDPQDTSDQQFRQSHHLTGVLTSNGRSVAMIDGKIVALGQMVDGYRLTSIEHRSVTFEANGSCIDLNMVERSTAVAGRNNIQKIHP